MPLKTRTPKRHWLLWIIGAATLYMLYRIVERASPDTVVWVSPAVALVLYSIVYLAASTAGREALVRLVATASEATGRLVELKSGGLLGGLGSFSVTSTSAGPTPEEEAAAAAMNRNATDAA